MSGRTEKYLLAQRRTTLRDRRTLAIALLVLVALYLGFVLLLYGHRAGVGTAFYTFITPITAGVSPFLPRGQIAWISGLGFIQERSEGLLLTAFALGSLTLVAFALWRPRRLLRIWALVAMSMYLLVGCTLCLPEVAV